MTNFDYLEHIYSLLKASNSESLNMSLNDVHHKGLFSLVIGGTEFGKLTRIFIAHKTIKPNAVQLHSHRYPIKLTALMGDIKHYVAKENDTNIDCSTLQLSKFKYKSPLNGGSGLTYLQDTTVNVIEHPIILGSSLNMRADEIHSVSCKKGSIWIVEECGFQADESIVLGVPFITDGLYNKPEGFQINDNHQLALKAVANIINSYKSIN